MVSMMSVEEDYLYLEALWSVVLLGPVKQSFLFSIFIPSFYYFHSWIRGHTTYSDESNERKKKSTDKPSDIVSPLFSRNETRKPSKYNSLDNTKNNKGNKGCRRRFHYLILFAKFQKKIITKRRKTTRNTIPT